MDRRSFLFWTAGTATLAASSESRSPMAAETMQDARIRKPIRMHVGTQSGPTTPELLQQFNRHGVDHICSYPPDPDERGYWLVEDLEKTREPCQSDGIRLEMVALPLLTLSHVDREKRPAIKLMPDHMPWHDDYPGVPQAFAFAYCYINGLLQVIDFVRQASVGCQE